MPLNGISNQEHRHQSHASYPTEHPFVGCRWMKHCRIAKDTLLMQIKAIVQSEGMKSNAMVLIYLIIFVRSRTSTPRIKYTQCIILDPQHMDRWELGGTLRSDFQCCENLKYRLWDNAANHKHQIEKCTDSCKMLFNFTEWINKTRGNYQVYLMDLRRKTCLTYFGV